MKQESKVINGVTYKVTTMDALSALSVQAKLLKLLGGAFAEVSGGASKENISKAVTKLAENIDDRNVISLITKLFEKNVFYTEVVNDQEITKPIDFSSYFSGKTADMWLVVIFIIQTNFSDVFAKLGFDLNSLNLEP